MTNFDTLLNALMAERSTARLAGQHDKAETLCEIISKIQDAQAQYECEVEE